MERPFVEVCKASDPQWLDERLRGITASEMAGLLGLSPWTSPLKLYAEKIGASERKDISEEEYEILRQIAGEGPLAVSKRLNYRMHMLLARGLVQARMMSASGPIQLELTEDGRRILSPTGPRQVREWDPDAETGEEGTITEEELRRLAFTLEDDEREALQALAADTGAAVEHFTVAVLVARGLVNHDEESGTIEITEEGKKVLEATTS